MCNCQRAVFYLILYPQVYYDYAGSALLEIILPDPGLCLSPMSHLICLPATFLYILHFCLLAICTADFIKRLSLCISSDQNSLHKVQNYL